MIGTNEIGQNNKHAERWRNADSGVPQPMLSVLLRNVRLRVEVATYRINNTPHRSKLIYNECTQSYIKPSRKLDLTVAVTNEIQKFIIFTLP